MASHQDRLFFVSVHVSIFRLRPLCGSLVHDYLYLAPPPPLVFPRPVSHSSTCVCCKKHWMEVCERSWDDVRKWNGIPAVRLTSNMLLHNPFCSAHSQHSPLSSDTTHLWLQKKCICRANSDILRVAGWGRGWFAVFRCPVLGMEILVCQSATRMVIIPLLTQATHCFGVNSQGWETDRHINISYTSIHSGGTWQSVKGGHTNR